MIGGADENEAEAQPSTSTATPPSPPSPPIATPSSPLQGTGLARRLLGSIRALALPTPPPAAAPKVGLGLLLHLRPDHPSLHPATPSASPSPSTSEDPLDEDAAAARPHASAWPRSPVSRYRIADAAATSAPTNSIFAKRAPHLLQHLTPAADTAGDQESGLVDGQQANEFRAGDESRPALVASPSEDESIATDVSSVSEEDHSAEWPHAAQGDTATSAPSNTMFRQSPANRAPHLLRYLKPDTAGDLALEDHDAAAGDDQEENVLQQCTGDRLGAARDDQEVVHQGAIHPRDETTYDIAAEDQEKVGLAENVDAMEGQELVEQDAIDKKGEGTDGTAAEDQDKAVEQCDTYGLGTTENGDAEDDREAVEQCVIDKEGAAMDDNAVKNHEVVGPAAVDGMHATMVDVSAEYQEKKVRQCATYDSETIENDDAVEDQEVVEQGVVYREALAIDHDDSIQDHEVVQRSIIEGMPSSTDDVAVEDQKKVVEQCVVHEPRATTDEYTVEEKEVVEQGVIDKQGATNKDVAVKDQDELMKQHIIDNQGTVPMDDIVVKDRDKAAAQYASDAIITYRDVEEHNKVGNQGVIDENGRTKDDIDVEEHDYLKEQVIVDNWGTFNDATTLEDQKNEAKLCNVDEQIAGKDIYAVHNKGSMLEQRTGGKQGATKSDFTVEKHKDVVERVCHEWGAPDDDLAMDTAASQSIREISSSEVVSATANGSDWGTWKKEKVKLPIRYPQRPGKLNCPFYMSNGSCSYGFSCQFHHPPLKAKPDGSWCPSEQGNHGVAEILELNRIGLPIREGARNCTYYMRNGACRYGKHCHFNHPEHVIDAQFYAPTGWEDNALQLEKSSDHATLDDTSHLKKSSDGATLDDTSYSKKFSDHATFDDTSYSKKSSDHATLDDMSCSSEVLPPKILRMLLPPQKVLPSTQGKVMQVKKDSNWSSTSDDSDGCCSADSSDGPLCKQEHVDSSDGPLCKQEHVDYPERPGEPECPFYMKKRFCKFGAQCMFNHPKHSNPTTQSPTNAKKSAASNEHHQSTRITLEDHMPQQQQYPERPGQPDCRYYLQFGECKFLSACIFHHPRDGLPVEWNPSGPAHSDQIGPETHGMPECPFYMKTGKCHFGSACEFRHPKDICSTTEGAFGHRTDLAYDNFTRPENAVQKQEQTMYPERPGEPRCFNYMRHGTCRFQMNCKYHHPADRLSTKQYDSTYH